MLFIILEAELQALLKPTKAARGRKTPKCSRCGNLMKGHKRGACSGLETTDT
jgi:hypothetical protein